MCVSVCVCKLDKCEGSEKCDKRERLPGECGYKWSESVCMRECVCECVCM